MALGSISLSLGSLYKQREPSFTQKTTSVGSWGRQWESFTSISHLPGFMVMGEVGGKQNDDFISRNAGAVASRTA